MSSSKSIRLYLIRHGEVTKRGYCNGYHDVPLTSRGVQQMGKVARLFRLVPIKAVYSSDLQRARRGASMIARLHRLTPCIHPELREKSFGHWEGLSLRQIQHHFREEWNEWLIHPGRARPKLGESYRQVLSRVLPVVQRIVREHRSGNIVVVSHGGVNRVILSHVLGLDLRFLHRIRQDYAAINLIELSRDGGTVVLMNAHSIPRPPIPSKR